MVAPDIVCGTSAIHSSCAAAQSANSLERPARRACALRLNTVILIRYRKTITRGGTQRNLFRPDPLAHPSPCVERADLRVGDYRGAGTPWLPAERRDPISPAARIGTRRLSALLREKERPACPPSLQSNCKGPPGIAGGEEQGPGAVRR